TGETLTYHYERRPDDPRLRHELTLEVDGFGNVLKSVAAGYGRRRPDAALLDADRQRQTQPLVVYPEERVTRSVDTANDYRAPLPAQSSTYELTGYAPTGRGGRFRAADFIQADPNDPTALVPVFDQEIQFEEQPTHARQRRLLERTRTLYR